MKKKIVFLIVMLVLVAGTYTGYKYLYKDHRDITKEVAVMETTAAGLQEQFQNNAADALLNKTLTVTGVVTQIESRSITIEDKVHCSFESAVTGVAVGDQVNLKGRCIGYDDLFEIVKLDQSTLIYTE
ncbi:MAG: hypothetical protein AAF489_16530 [Bacteroidota bacterium]